MGFNSGLKGLNLILKFEIINKGFVIDCSVDKNNLTSNECQVFG
jgi:hypothetical protein